MKRLKHLLLISSILALPVAALAAGGGAEAGPATPWIDLALKAVNFVGLLAILYFALRKVVPQTLTERKESIAKELKGALAAKEDAEKQLADYKVKVANLQQEMEQLKTDFKAEGEVQHKRILDEAAAAAEAIANNAAAAGDREVRRVSEQLRGEAIKQALELAEQILSKSYSAADQSKALEQTVEKIEGLH